MSRLRDSAVRLVNLFRRDRVERELDAELQAYLELDIEENIRRGMAPREARRTALARQRDHPRVDVRQRPRTGLPATPRIIPIIALTQGPTHVAHPSSVEASRIRQRTLHGCSAASPPCTSSLASGTYQAIRRSRT